MTTKIFCLAHKEVPYGLPYDSVVKPLQVGFAEQFTPLTDDTGDNISEWNDAFCEVTGLYWIWKNVKADIKGQFQYRRRLPIDENTDYEEIFKDHDVIVAMPCFYRGLTPYQSYCKCHATKDMVLLEEIIRDLHPEYLESFNYSLKASDHLFYSNGFVMRGEEYDKFCEWMFGIIWEFFRRRGWNTPEDVRYSIGRDIQKKERSGNGHLQYQMRVGGYLSERLWTVYLQRNFPPERVMMCKYQLMEGTVI